MAWKRIKEKEYTCLSTDTKVTSGIAVESTLVEVQPDGSLKGYLFYQDGWRGGWTL